MTLTIGPQAGPQTEFCRSAADITIYGGAAGGGKTYGLLLCPLAYLFAPDGTRPPWNGVILRSQAKDLRQPGGIWQSAIDLYSRVRPIPSVVSVPTPNITWPVRDGVQRLTMTYVNHLTKANWQGAQLDMALFDEATHFELDVVLFIMSRLRPGSAIHRGVNLRSLTRMSCNPDPDHFLAQWLSWWIDPDTGYPNPERANATRFVRFSGTNFYSSHCRHEVCEMAGDNDLDSVRTLQFIPSSIHDNQRMLSKSTAGLAYLNSLDSVMKERMLRGNWLVRHSAGAMFQPSRANIVEYVPPIARYARAWDLAATLPTDKSPNPDWTVGILGGVASNGVLYVTDVDRFRARPGTVRDKILAHARTDPPGTVVVLPIDPGQAGESQKTQFSELLSGIPHEFVRPVSTKTLRASPLASRWENCGVALLRSTWNKTLLDELDAFPSKTEKDDQVDALADLFNFTAPMGFASASAAQLPFR